VNADAVRAVEGALLASWKVANDSFWRGMAAHAAARDAATAVAAAEPIIRAQIAAEIEALRRSVTPSGDAVDPKAQAYLIRAREIAEGAS